MPPKRTHTDPPTDDVDPADAPDPAEADPEVNDETPDDESDDIDLGLSADILIVDEPAPLVRCRWLAPDPVLVKDPTARLVRYGDEIFLTEEQADDQRTTAARWDDDWTPDPELEALAAGYDQED